MCVVRGGTPVVPSHWARPHAHCVVAAIPVTVPAECEHPVRSLESLCKSPIEATRVEALDLFFFLATIF